MNNSIKASVLSRRQVMIGAAGLSFAIAAPNRLKATALSAEGPRSAMNPWISIATDGTITIMSAATEMGQGSMTSLPLIIAEELDADWDKVKIVPAPVNEKIYGNPGFGGMMYTAGSNAVTSYYRPLRMIGAQVRRVMLDNAARKWGVPVEELTTEPSVVVHSKSGRKMSYGDIAAIRSATGTCWSWSRASTPTAGSRSRSRSRWTRSRIASRSRQAPCGGGRRGDGSPLCPFDRAARSSPHG